jgi:hypothetical protein
MIADNAFLKFIYEQPIFLIGEDSLKHANIAPQPLKQTESAVISAPKTAIEKTVVPQITPKSPKEDMSVGVKKLLFIGENKRKITIIFEQKSADFLKTPEYDLLTKIINAVKLTPNEVALVNVSDNLSFSFEQIATQLAPEKCIIFGVNSSSLKMPIPTDKNTVLNMGKTQILYAESLTTLLFDRDKKIALWEVLKKIFV